MLESKTILVFFRFVEQIRTDHPARSDLGKKVENIRIRGHIRLLCKTIPNRFTRLFRENDPFLRIFFQLFADGGFVERRVRVRQRRANAVRDLRRRHPRFR